MMEDLATVEISRSQLWQWVRHGVRTAGGHTITPEYVNALLEEDVSSVLAASAFQCSKPALLCPSIRSKSVLFA